jgi:flavin-dependent dehydrogenase
MPAPITIIGGGLAGLTLGIALRQERIPVTVWEAGGYPRHRVCGEFMSGRGYGILVKLGLQDALREQGARPAQTVAFFEGTNELRREVLPEPAWCLSRYRLDHLLATAFEAAGGALHTGKRWRGSFQGDGLVRATGRSLPTARKRWRFFGLKVHARDVSLIADLELHFTDSGYVGLCRVEDTVNVCGCFHSRRPIANLASSWPRFLGGDPQSVLASRLAGAAFDRESFCAVAAFSFPGTIPRAGDCCLGDALGMVPPWTGNGMSFALESAITAARQLSRYSRGEVPWASAVSLIRRDCRKQFGARLLWAKATQSILFHPRSRRVLAAGVRRSGRLLDWLFHRTR